MGGVGTYTRYLAHAYVEMGHKVFILSSAVPPRKTYTYEDAGVFVRRVRRWKFEVPLARRVWHTFFPWSKHQWEYMLGITSELRRIVREEEIDVIESSELWSEGLAYSFFRECPIVIKLHSPLFLLRQLNGLSETRDWKLVDRVDKLWTIRADALVSASAALKEIITPIYKLDGAKIPVIPEAVDANIFRTSKAYPAEKSIVLFVGRLEPRKGIFVLAASMPKVLEKFPDAQFMFLGNDTKVNGSSCKEIIRRELLAAGVAHRAIFVDAVNSENIPAFHHNARVTVFPSIWENFSIATLEAMACGRPVVASNSGGFPEMIEDNISGVLVPPLDPDALAQAILQILEDKSKAEEMGASARKRVERYYSKEVVARQTFGVYEQAVEEWKNRPAKMFSKKRNRVSSRSFQSNEV